MTELNIEQTLEKFENGILNVESLWYDWFCQDRFLRSKGIKLLKRLNVIKKSSKFILEETYVFFKNNCPMSGSLYDDFRICKMDGGKVLYTIVPSSGFTFNKGKDVVWGRGNDFAEPLVEGSWKDVKKFFLG